MKPKRVIEGRIAAFTQPKPGCTEYGLLAVGSDKSRIEMRFPAYGYRAAMEAIGIKFNFGGYLKDIIGQPVKMYPDDLKFYGLAKSEEIPTEDSSKQCAFYDDSWTADFIDHEYKKEFCTCGGRPVVTSTFQDGSHASHYNRTYWIENREKIEKFMEAKRLNPAIHARDWKLATMPQVYMELCRDLNCVNDRFNSHPFYAGTKPCKYPRPIPDNSVLRGVTVWTQSHMRATQLIRILMTDRATKVTERIKFITTSSLVAKILNNEARAQLFAGSFVFIHNNIASNENVIGMQMIELLMDRINKRLPTLIIDPRWHEGSQLSKNTVPSLITQGLVRLL